MLRGDEQAMARLEAAGARPPAQSGEVDFTARVSELASSVRRVDAMIADPDIRATAEWYRSIGFELEGTHETERGVDWAGLSFGGCYLMFVPSGTKNARREVSFWFRTTRVDELYRLLRDRQLDRATAVREGHAPDVPEARFTQDLHDTFYGEREFTLVDVNGYELTFAQSLEG